VFEDSHGRFVSSRENGVVRLGSGRVAVVGTGLIGASVGLAAKRAGVESVAGFDSDPGALSAAVELGAVDSAAVRLDDVVGGVDLVVVATPVGAIAARVADALALTGHECAVTDVGSTKASICAALAGESRFVGGHPLAGSESQGPHDARADLFEGSTWFLTPLPETERERYRRVRDFVVSLGAEPVAIDPVAHDRLVALTSHLPHALANALVSQVAAANVAGHDALATAGRSFADMTRIAGANSHVWVEVFLDNAEALADALAGYRLRIEQLEAALRSGDVEAVARSIDEAAQNRRRLPPR
jgi:prephenate dehydrogenase